MSKKEGGEERNEERKNIYNGGGGCVSIEGVVHTGGDGHDVQVYRQQLMWRFFLCILIQVHGMQCMMKKDVG